MITALRDPLRPTTSSDEAVAGDRPLYTLYALSHAEVRARLEEALRAGRAGVSPADLEALDGPGIREGVLSALIEPARLARARVASVPASGEPGGAEPGVQRRLEEMRAIYRLSETVMRAQTVEPVYEAALEGLAQLLEADRASVLLFDPDGVLRFKVWRGLSDAYRQAVTGHSPWSPADVDAEPILVEDVLLEPSLEAYREVIVREGVRALGFIPLVGGEALLGKFMVYFDRPHRFTRGEVELARTIAHHIGFALERMRHDAELTAVNQQLLLAGAREQLMAAETRAAEQRAAFLAEASRVLAGSLDFEGTLRSVGELLVPRLVDWSAIDLPTDDGRIERVSVAHRDPGRAELLREIRRRFPLAVADPADPVAAVIRGGRPRVEAGEAEAAALVADDWRREALRRLGVTAYVVVPLVARGRILGALTMGLADSARRLGQGDLGLAEDLAGRVALAIDNARLFRDAQAAIRDALAATRARDAFLARASHELRTPLTSALGMLRLLKRAMAGSLPEPPERLVEIANRNLDAMLALVNDLLDASKLGADPTRVEASELDLRDVLARSVEALEAQAREQQVAVELEASSPLPMTGDADRLEQVFVNLLANAIRHSPAGERVVVEAVVEGESLLVRVGDRGDGIEPADLERIFEPFVRAGGGRARRRGGTGLGLAICRQIVTLHGGRIWAESQGPGCGSAFLVRLSRRVSAERAA